MICKTADGCKELETGWSDMGMILLAAGAGCIIVSIVLFLLYLTMGKAVGRKLMKKLRDEY